ncbi:MAG: hypothetical protein ACP5GS_06855 [Nitrososphaeria archaeon]
MQEEDYEHYKDILDKLLEIGGLVLAGDELTLLLAYYTVFTESPRGIVFIGALAGLGIMILIPTYFLEIVSVNNAQKKNLPLSSSKIKALAVFFTFSYVFLLSPLTAVAVSAITIMFNKNYSVLLIYSVVFVLYVLTGLLILYLLNFLEKK